jgi:hypothetical protein
MSLESHGTRIAENTPVITTDARVSFRHPKTGKIVIGRVDAINGERATVIFDNYKGRETTPPLLLKDLKLVSESVVSPRAVAQSVPESIPTVVTPESATLSPQPEKKNNAKEITGAEIPVIASPEQQVVQVQSLKERLTSPEMRERYRMEVVAKVATLVEKAENTFVRADDSRLQGEWHAYNKTGLRDTRLAQSFLKGSFLRYFATLDEKVTKNELDPEHAVDVDDRFATLRRSAEIIDSLIERVNKNLEEAAVTPMLLAEPAAVGEVPPDEVVSVVGNVDASSVTEALTSEVEGVTVAESVEMSHVGIETINIEVSNVEGLPLKEQIGAYVSKVEEVSRHVNERLAKFGPTHIDAEQRRKLVDIHDRLVRLSDVLKSRFAEQDESVLKNNNQVPKTIGWVKEDLRSIQRLVAEAEVVAKSVPEPVVTPDAEVTVTPETVAVVTDAESTLVLDDVDVTPHDEVLTVESEPSVVTDIDMNHSPFSSKNISLRENAHDTDEDEEEAALFARANVKLGSITSDRTPLNTEKPAPYLLTDKMRIVREDAAVTVLESTVDTVIEGPLNAVTSDAPAQESVSADQEAVAHIVGRIKSVPYLTASEQGRVDAMYENYLRLKQEGRSDTVLAQTLRDIQSFGEDLVNHPTREQLTERLAALKADVSSTTIPGRNTETITTLIENVERIAAEEALVSDDQPRTIAAYNNLVAFIADDALRLRKEKEALPSAGRYETAEQVMARTEFVPMPVGSAELLRTKNEYRDALIHAIKIKNELRTNSAFVEANRSGNFSEAADNSLYAAAAAYERELTAVQTPRGLSAAIVPAAEIIALKTELEQGSPKRNRLKRAAQILALGLGLVAADELGDGTLKNNVSVPSPAPYSASEISEAPTMSPSATVDIVPNTPSMESTPVISESPAALAFDAAYPPVQNTDTALNLDVSLGTVEATPLPQADRWGSLPTQNSSPTIETIPALTIHNFSNGEGLIKVGRGVTEVGALSVMEHVPLKQRESVIDLTVARIAASPTLQAELNVGIDRATGDVFIYAGRPLNVTAYERELAATAKATGVYIEAGEKTGVMIPPRPFTNPTAQVESGESEASVAESPATTLEDLHAYVENYSRGPAALADAVTKWARDVEGSYYIAPGSRILSLFTQHEYLDPYKALAKKTISEIMNVQVNKNVLARSQIFNEWRITAEGFKQWADKIENFVRHYDLRGASDLTLEKAAALMLADAELSKTENAAL